MMEKTIPGMRNNRQSLCSALTTALDERTANPDISNEERATAQLKVAIPIKLLRVTVILPRGFTSAARFGEFIT